MTPRKYRRGEEVIHPVRFDTETFLSVDEWRNKQPVPPARAAVIKMAVKEFLENHPFYSGDMRQLF